MKRIALLLFTLPIFSYGQQSDIVTAKTIKTIAFGSCSKQDLPDQQLWKEVNEEEPDLWIWLGDNIYGDTEEMQVMQSKYELQKSHPEYQMLLANTPVIGIWDDHDFGANDAGKEYPKKAASKAELFRFLDISPDHPARSREGAYQSYTYQSKDWAVKVVLLDARSFRDELTWGNPGTQKKAAIANPEGDILGKDQWNWLKEQLSEDNIDLFLLASGIQIIPTEHRWEKWANFPKSRKRLLGLIASTVSKPLILLSGDRHISEASSIELPGYPYRLWEYTSSSLTSPITRPKPEPNRYRDQKIVYPQNFAIMNIEVTNSILQGDVTFVGQNNEVHQKHYFNFKSQ